MSIDFFYAFLIGWIILIFFWFLSIGFIYIRNPKGSKLSKNIVYISCNPSTQARDASALSDYGYLIEKITLVDQFPHTGHIESIIKFKSSKK